LEAQDRSFNDRREQWEAQRAETQRQLDTRCGELEARGVELEAREAELKTRKVEFEARGAELESREAELETREAELGTGTTEPAEARRQPDRARPGAAPKETDERLSQNRGSAEETPHGLQPAQTSSEPSEATAAGPAGPSNRQASGDAPVSLIDVLRRLGSNIESSAGKEEADPAAVPTAGEAAADRQSADLDGRPSGGRAGPGNEEEESMDTYTARWLARVRGTSDLPASAPEPEPEPESPRPPESGQETSEPVDFPRRATAREKHIDLSAMRELANLSASSALSNYARRLSSRAARGKLWVAVVTLAAGAAVLWLGGWPEASDLSSRIATVSFVVALFWLAQYASLRGRVRAGQSVDRDDRQAAAPPHDGQ
jgi:hypothetical protein